MVFLLTLSICAVPRQRSGGMRGPMFFVSTGMLNVANSVSARPLSFVLLLR